MDFDQLLIRFFGSADIAALSPGQIADGADRLRLDLAMRGFGARWDGSRAA